MRGGQFWVSSIPNKYLLIRTFASKCKFIINKQMSDQVVTSEHFKWILLEIFVQILLYIVQLLAGGSMRAKHFGKEFMDIHFQREFEQIGIKIPAGGVPDCGTGRFSDKLKHADWLDYNTAQYVSNSAVQSVLATALVTFLLGIYLPKWGVWVGLFFIIWRIVYAIAAKSSPSTLAVLEPASHLVFLLSCTTVTCLAYQTAKSS